MRGNPFSNVFGEGLQGLSGQDWIFFSIADALPALYGGLSARMRCTSGIDCIFGQSLVSLWWQSSLGIFRRVSALDMSSKPSSGRAANDCWAGGRGILVKAYRGPKNTKDAGGKDLAGRHVNAISTTPVPGDPATAPVEEGHSLAGGGTAFACSNAALLTRILGVGEGFGATESAAEGAAGPA
mmetsp:Transcript_8284/g.18545  ORF Transcript_8284/g.18545 Transcript_8284/m.18545 type:complete len:183 (+) Transcript_8284:124-672(+)